MRVCFRLTNSLNDSHLRISRLIIAIHRCSQTLTTMLRPITLETRNQLLLMSQSVVQIIAVALLNAAALLPAVAGDMNSAVSGANAVSSA
jgi:hypothetical protein